MSRLEHALAWGLLLALPACDGNPAGSRTETLVADPDRMELRVGQSAPVISAVVGGPETVLVGIVYWSRNTSVAQVSPGGLVTAVVPGVTTVMVRYETLLDSVQVTVLRDTRADLQKLDIVPDEVAAATQSGTLTVPYVALDGYGRTRCAPTGFSLRMNPFIVSAWIHATPTSCAIVIVPGAEGETYVVASVEGLSDSVLVKVENGAYQAMFSSETAVSATAGAATPLSVLMLDPRGQPVAGRTVWFTAAPGLLSQTTAVTDSTGTATVTWTTPRVLAAAGGVGHIAFRTLFPTGGVREESRSVLLLGGPPRTVEWFTGDPPLRVGGRALTAALNSYRIISAIGRDAHGNQTMTVPAIWYVVLSGPAPATHDVRGVRCVDNLDDPQGRQVYPGCYTSYGFQAAEPSDIRVYASFAGVTTDSLDVSFR